MPDVSMDKFLERYGATTRELARHARAAIVRECPDATMRIWPGWKMIGFGTGRRMADMVCGIGPLRNGISIIFTRGAELPDANGLLTGTSRTGRRVRIETREQIDSPAVQHLIRLAFALHRAGRPTRRGRSASRVTTRAAKSASGGGRDTDQVAASKTIKVPVAVLYDAWAHTRRRRRWLSDATFEIRKANQPRSLRITWSDGSNLDVTFHARGVEKSQVSVDHRRLDPALVPAMKAYWNERLAALKEDLET